ncbi:MAG: polymer-forming cytoskeletal protein [Deltaproteobacteria bacterium]|nr:polymer-forming cytoskeletal protein [Deltaproteobacteria bacterium]
MFGEKSSGTEGGSRGQISGLLEKGCEFEGKLTFEGTVRINGKFTGEIFSEGTLVVGEGALVDGKIDVGSIMIHGEVSGSIQAVDRIEMHAPAVVKCDIRAQTLVIDEGVVFEGSCSMGKGATVHKLDTEKQVAN